MDAWTLRSTANFYEADTDLKRDAPFLLGNATSINKHQSKRALILVNWKKLKYPVEGKGDLPLLPSPFDDQEAPNIR